MYHCISLFNTVSNNSYLHQKRKSCDVSNESSTKSTEDSKGNQKEKNIFSTVNLNKVAWYKKDKSTKKGIRGSKYRGVSRNGNQWQVLIMINKKKRYIGNYKTEEEAAKNYDKVALKYHGDKAKTNFVYSAKEIREIINSQPKKNYI